MVEDQYAVSPDGMRMFGVLALDIEENGVRVSIGLRNSHDKSFALGITIGYHVFVCDNVAFHGDFQTVTRKHSKNLVLNDVLAVAIDRMQRNFAPMLNQVNAWKGYELPDASAKLVIYRAFIEEGLEVPKRLADDVHGTTSNRARRVPAAHDVESLERLHVRLQAARSDPAVQGDGAPRAGPRGVQSRQLSPEKGGRDLRKCPGGSMNNSNPHAQA